MASINGMWQQYHQSWRRRRDQSGESGVVCTKPASSSKHQRKALEAWRRIIGGNKRGGIGISVSISIAINKLGVISKRIWHRHNHRHRKWRKAWRNIAQSRGWRQ